MLVQYNFRKVYVEVCMRFNCWFWYQDQLYISIIKEVMGDLWSATVVNGSHIVYGRKRKKKDIHLGCEGDTQLSLFHDTVEYQKQQ